MKSVQKHHDFFLRLFNIRKGEERIVLNFFTIEFFQSAGIAFFFSLAIVLFLQNFRIDDLPKELAKVYILSAFLLWITFSLYSWIERKINIRNYGLYIILFIATSILAFRLYYEMHPGKWFYYLLLSWYSVLYMLSNLEFWGMASLFFDVRQSKRLFGVISAGDIPSKFIGFMLALVAVEYFGVKNLFVICFFLILCSIPFFFKIQKKLKKEQVPGHKDHLHKKPSAGHIFQPFLDSFSGNKLIARISMLSFLFILSMYLINYVFYSQIKVSFPNDKDLTRFIILFLAITRLIALFFKTIFTSRIISKQGYKRTLLITPLTIGLFILILLFSFYYLMDQKLIFYLFGMLFVVADVLRSSVHTPVFLTLMQPLNISERLRAHNVVKGILDPFAYLVAGLLLYFFVKYYSAFELIDICYVLLGLAVLCVIWIILVNREYLNTLVHSISTKYFTEGEIDVSDTASIEKIAEKIETSNELEQLYLLKLLEKQPLSKRISELIINLLESQFLSVYKECLRIIKNKKLTEALPKLRLVIASGQSAILGSEAVKVLCAIGFEEDEILPLTSHEDYHIRQAALSGILLNSSQQNVFEKEEILKKLVYSENISDRKSACAIIGEMNNGLYDLFLIRLLQDPDKEVMGEAIRWAGISSRTEPLKAILKLLPHYRDFIREAILHAGIHAIPAIQEYILSGNCSENEARKLLLLCGQIKCPATCAMLAAVLEKKPSLTYEIIEVLYKCNFRLEPHSKEKFENLIAGYDRKALLITDLKSKLNRVKEYELLYRSLNIELDVLKELLLKLYSFLFGKENILKIEKGLNSRKKEEKANALELIEMSITKQFAVPFLTIFEKRLQQENITHTRQLSTDLQQVFHTILLEEENDFMAWTKACCLYSGLKNELVFNKNLIARYNHSENRMLKEIIDSFINFE